MPAQITLTIRMADGVAQKRLLHGGAYTLGRELDCDVIIESSDVSRHHARLILTEKDFQVVDLGSTLGTKLNGQPLSGPQRAGYPAMLQLGSVNISVAYASEEADLKPPVDDSAPPAANPRARIPLEFRHEIARGGMGSILEADDCKLGRRVAVKIMLSELEADDYQKQRFVHEAAVLGRLAHPNIVPVYDIGEDAEGQLYYSMKLVKGRTLQAILNGLRDHEEATARDYPLNTLLTIFRKVCDAMAFAHSRGIIHRDLKPENVMVGEFGEVLVMDWGLAKFLEFSRSGGLPQPASSESAVTNRRSLDEATNFGMTLEGDVMGTPQYMSPEQAEGKINELDARSDIYSLGGILYTILTLRPPIEGKTLEEVLGKVVSGSITPLTQGGATLLSRKGAAKEPQAAKPRSECRSSLIPPALAAVTMKAMSVQRAKRYPEVAALAADIEAYQNGFATSAENAGAWKQLTLFMKRNKAASIGVAAVLLIGTTLGTKAFVEGRRATEALNNLKKTAPAMLQLARSEADSQHFESALEKLDASLVLDPSAGEAWWERVWLLVGLERWEDARAAFRAAQQHDATQQLPVKFDGVLDDYAAASESDRWKSGLTDRLLGLLQEVKAAATQVRLSTRLMRDAKPRQQLVKAKLEAWLGKGQAKVEVSPEGLVVVSNLPANITSLDTLRGLPIGDLSINDTRVSSLEPLRGMLLRRLRMYNLAVHDLAPLRGMPLQVLEMDGCHDASDLSALRGMPLTLFNASGCGISDLSPLKGAPLSFLSLRSDHVADLSPLADCPLTNVALSNNRGIYDLSPLRGKRITTLIIAQTQVTDLTPLRGMPLQMLNLSQTPVSDLTPLKGLPIEELELEGATAKDLTPLLTLPKLERLYVNNLKSGLAALRQHPTLKFIAAGHGGLMPVAQFWKDYDAKKAGGEK